MGNHLFLGRRDMVGVNTDEIRYMSSFILITLPWVFIAANKLARVVVLGMDPSPGNY